MKKSSYNNTRRKIIILLAALGLFTVAGLYYFFEVEHTRSRTLLDKEHVESTNMLKNMIAVKSHTLLTFVTDYTFWDDMVQFTKTGDTTWAAENIKVSLRTYESDMAWVFNSSSKLVYFVSQEETVIDDTAVVNGEIISEILRKDRFCHFFVNTEAGLIEVMGATIHPTSDINRITAPAGYFAVGRLWTKDFLKEIETLTSSEVEIIDSAENNGPVPDDFHKFISRGSYVLNSWNNHPVALLRSEKRMDILAEMHNKSETQFAFIIAFIAASLMFTGFSLNYLVNRPLKKIGEAMKEGDAEYIKDLIGRKNEFGKMAELVNEFFIQREKLLNEIKEKSEAEFKIRLSEEQLRKSLAEKVVLIKEVHHRVKNNLQVIISLLKLQSDSITDKVTIQYLNTSLNRIRSIAYVHELLYRSHDLSKIDFELYLNKIVHSLRSIYTNETVRIRIEIESKNVFLSVDKAVPCAVIINELISNSMKHAFKGRKEGCIRIKMSEESNIYRLSISDDGIGFGTGMNMSGSKTLGLFLVSSLSDQLDAELNITNHVGSEFELIFKAEDATASKLPLPTN